MANKRRLKFWFVFLLILMGSGILLSQEQNIQIKHLTIDDGLSQNSPNGMIQDRKGFIWIGTEDGLNKYDGYHFRIYHHDPQNSHSLSDNYIYCLYEDRAGMIWIGTRNGGLSRFDPTLDTFGNYLHDQQDETTLSWNTVRSITEDQNGNIWIGTENGLNRLDPISDTITRYFHDPKDPHSISDNVIWSIEEDHSGALWIGTNRGLNRLDPETGRFQVYLHDANNSRSISDNVVMALHRGDTGEMWIGTKDGGLNRLDIRSMSFTSHVHLPGKSQSLSSNWICGIEAVESNTLWIATYGGGLNRMNISKGTFTSYQNDPKDPSSLSDNELYSVIQDRSGIIWVGTNTGGINILIPNLKHFQHFYYQPKNPYSLSHKVIWSIYQDRSGIFWVGTARGLNRYDPKTGKFSLIRIQPVSQNPPETYDIRTITEDSEGNLWLGLYAEGLVKLDPKTGNCMHYRHHIDQLNPNIVRKIFFDSRGTMWVGTAGGLNRFDRTLGRFYRYVNNPNDPESLPHDFILDIYEDRDGQLWIGTWGGGVCKFNHVTEKFSCHRPDISDPFSLPNGVVWCVTQDPSGIFWLGTSLGLCRYDPITGRFNNWTVKDGLPNNTVYAILVDSKSDSMGNPVQISLWLTTNYGLCHFDPKNQSFRNYDVNDGLQSNEFNAGAYFKDKSGKMFFGGINGITAFYPDEIKNHNYIPPVVITSFEVYNKQVAVGSEIRGRVLLKQSIDNLDVLNLTYKHNIFTFEFSALHFASPENNQYMYMLEGFDEDWNETTHDRRYASYTNLSAGRYTFKVKGSNCDGVWNEEATSIQVSISPPFYQTLWFRIFSILCFILIFILFYELRTFTYKRRTKELEKRVEERTVELQWSNEKLKKTAEKLEAINSELQDFAHVISHDLKAPLRGIVHLVKWIEDEQADKFNKNGKEHINLLKSRVQRMSRLIDGVLKYSKAGHPEEDIQEINLNQFLPVIIDLLAPSSGIQIEVQEDMPTISSHRTQIQQVFQNLISNAIRYIKKKKGLIRIGFSDKNKYWEFHVSDNGIGIDDKYHDKIFKMFKTVIEDNEKGTSGVGLSVVKKIIERLGGKIWVESQIGKGSTFYFTLPKDIDKPFQDR